ncbi:MAG: XRE family transcriptional regulator [Rhodospirillaceae bacterium]|nr:XRE family transcriptional regulator [Rhodospirillaceae bacterium]
MGKKQAITKKTNVSSSTGSAFHALGLPEADDLVLRADLLRKIAEIVKARGMSQTEAGKLMGMDQPRVSALLRGQITKFSTDRLLRALSDLGQDVVLSVSPSRRSKGQLWLAA